MVYPNYCRGTDSSSSWWRCSYYCCRFGSCLLLQEWIKDCERFVGVPGSRLWAGQLEKAAARPRALWRAVLSAEWRCKYMHTLAYMMNHTCIWLHIRYVCIVTYVYTWKNMFVNSCTYQQEWVAICMKVTGRVYQIWGIILSTWDLDDQRRIAPHC